MCGVLFCNSSLWPECSCGSNKDLGKVNGILSVNLHWSNSAVQDKICMTSIPQRHSIEDLWRGGETTFSELMKNTWPVCSGHFGSLDLWTINQRFLVWQCHREALPIWDKLYRQSLRYTQTNLPKMQRAIKLFCMHPCSVNSFRTCGFMLNSCCHVWDKFTRWLSLSWKLLCP